MGRERLVPQAAPVSPEKGAIMEQLKIQGTAHPHSPFYCHGDEERALGRMQRAEEGGEGKAGEAGEERGGGVQAKRRKEEGRGRGERGRGRQACLSQLERLVGFPSCFFSHFRSISCLPGQTLPRGYWREEGFAHYPAAGPVTFEGEGSNHLGLNCKMATWKAAGEQLLGLVLLLNTPNH